MKLSSQGSERGKGFAGGKRRAKGAPTFKRGPGLNSASLTRGERVSPVVDNQGKRTDLIFQQGSWSCSRELYTNEVRWVRSNEL